MKVYGRNLEVQADEFSISQLWDEWRLLFPLADYQNFVYWLQQRSLNLQQCNTQTRLY